jgi:hypothetical protein
MARMPAPLRRLRDAAINIAAAALAVLLYFGFSGVAIVVADDPRWLPPALLVTGAFVGARFLLKRRR